MTKTSVGSKVGYILLVLGACVIFFPVFWMALTSLKTAPEIQLVPPTFFPKDIWNTANYREVCRRVPFVNFLLNSFFVASVSSISSVFVSSLAGYGYAKFNFPGKNFFFFATIGVLMVPFQSIVVPLYLQVNRMGLVNTYLGVMIPFFVSGFGVFLMREAIEIVPDSYIDAAKIDGCSNIGIFMQIILPSVKPTLVTLAIIKFMWTWNELLWPLVVISRQSKYVVTLGLSSFTTQQFREYHLLTAAAVLSVIPTIALFLLFQKWIVRGITMSGLKG